MTWADTRATEQAERLRAADTAAALHRRTGTPLHPMSPLAKLVWIRETDPDLMAAASRWGGIKELVVHALTGELAVDHGVASATGLLDLHALDWDAEALALAGLDRDRLCSLVPTGHQLRLGRDAAERLGLPAGLPVVVGGADGPLANLGVGAVTPGAAACSIGTSGALRVVADAPRVDQAGSVFCAVLTEGRFVVGGAVNNGGIVLDWLHDALAPELAEDGVEPVLLELAGSVPAGSGGLLMLPHLLSERAPDWTSLPRGAYLGLTRDHRREHMVRAAVEGVCLHLATVLASLPQAGVSVDSVRATGGFARSPFWRQLLADAFGRDVGYPRGHQGTSRGAALLGMHALGMLDSLDEAAALVPLESTCTPGPDAEVYARTLPVFRAAQQQLTPTFRALRDLAPDLPLSRPE